MKIEDLVECPEAEALIRDLIDRHSLHLSHLRNVQGSVWLVAKPTKSKGQLVKGKVKLHADIDRMLHESDLVYTVFLDEGYWKDYPDRREPLLFSQLVSIGLKENGEDFEIRKPTVVEFPEVLAHYGLWSDELHPIAAHHQPELWTETE